MEERRTPRPIGGSEKGGGEYIPLKGILFDPTLGFREYFAQRVFDEVLVALWVNGPQAPTRRTCVVRMGKCGIGSWRCGVGSGAGWAETVSGEGSEAFCKNAERPAVFCKNEERRANGVMSMGAVGISFEGEGKRVSPGSALRPAVRPAVRTRVRGR